jgi:hypothetical protein
MKREPLFQPAFTEPFRQIEPRTIGLGILHLCWLVAKWTLILGGLLLGGVIAVFVGTLLPEQSGFADTERWGTYLAIYIAMWVVMARLERLGKQLEAVASVVREEIATAAERKQEIRDEWRYNKAQEAKDARGFWTFWGIVGAMGLLVWFGTWLRHHGP